MKIPASNSFAALNLLTLTLTYAKLEGDLYLYWVVIAIPTFVSLFVILATMIFTLYKNSGLQEETVIYRPIASDYDSKSTIFSAFMIIQLMLWLYLILSKIDSYENLRESRIPSWIIYTGLGVILVQYLIYSAFIYPATNADSESNSISIYTTITNFLASFLSSTVIVCSSGSCNSIYISTVTAFFSSFGISIAEYVSYLKWSVFPFIALTLYSSYNSIENKKSIPFLTLLFSAALICANTIFLDWISLVIIGNIGLVVSVLWMNRTEARNTLAKNKLKFSV